MPAPLSLVALFAPMLALIAITPDPIAFHLGPLSVYWYGVCYAVGLAAAYTVITREARRRGLNARLVDNGIIIVAVAAAYTSSRSSMKSISRTCLPSP